MKRYDVWVKGDLNPVNYIEQNNISGGIVMYNDVAELLKINQELVEALEAIMNVYGRSSRNPDEPGCIAKSRAALAKAKEGVE